MKKKTNFIVDNLEIIALIIATPFLFYVPVKALGWSAEYFFRGLYFVFIFFCILLQYEKRIKKQDSRIREEKMKLIKILKYLSPIPLFLLMIYIAVVLGLESRFSIHHFLFSLIAITGIVIFIRKAIKVFKSL